MATLASHLAATRQKLRDQATTAQLYTDDELINAINEARHQRDFDTRLVRTVVGFTLTTGLTTYSLNAVLSGGTAIRGEDKSKMSARDVISLHVIPQGAAGGIGIRYPLGRLPYSQAAQLASTSWLSYPFAFARVGTDAIALVPPPAQAYPSEWDLVGYYTPDLVNPTDPDPMPDPYNDPLPYLAASIAKINAQRPDEAALFEKAYAMRMNKVLGIRRIAIPSPGSMGRRG